MRIIKRSAEAEAITHIMNILDIIETLPRDAFGNSSDAVDKMAKLYYNTSELAYITAGTEGLNLCIEFFGRRAQSMDEVIAVSKAHIKTVSKHTNKNKYKKKEKKK